MQQIDNQTQFKVRFYRREFPNINELVIGQVVNSEQNGCYVQLPEFQNKKGMIPYNQYSKTMKRAVHRALKTGKQQVLRVMQVDKKGYIDLSKKNVNEADEPLGQEKFAKSKTVNAIVRHISQSLKVPMKDIYQQFVWDLYDKSVQHHPLQLLKQILIHQETIDELGIKTPEIKEKLKAELQRRFKQSLLKTVAIFEISILSADGINRIKQILKKGVQAAKERNYQVKIFIIGAPNYMIQLTTAKKQQGKQAIDIALNAIKTATMLDKQNKGHFNIRKEAKVTGDTNAIIADLQKDEQKQNENSDEEYDEQAE